MISNQPKFKFVLLVTDILILTISFCAAVTFTVPDFWAASERGFYFYFSYFSLYFPLILIYLLSFLFSNLYKRNIIISRYRQFVLIIKALIIGTIINILLMVVTNLGYFELYGKETIGYFFVASITLFALLRALSARHIFRFLAEKNIYQSRVLIVGGDDAGKHVAEALLNDKYSNFEIVGFLDGNIETGGEIYRNFKNLGHLNDIGDIVLNHKVNEILIAIENPPYKRLIDIVETCLQTGKVVRIYSGFLNVIAEKMNVEFYSAIPVIMLSQYSLRDYMWGIKRVVDIILSVCALILLSPLFLIISLGIKLSSSGPVIFKQVRIGRGGQPFNFYKFRSMHIDTDNSRHEEYVRDFIQNENKCENRDIKVFKITDDPRIFKFGKFIRKTSLDEFPQLINVIKGDMSLIGPRPCLTYEWNCYDEWHKERLNVLPGCTGLWQALGRSSVTFQEMVILDLYYISNMTLWLDLKIVLQTIPVIFFGKGGF